jgi:putative dimethyl sulfoxide reductase chaperone
MPTVAEARVGTETVTAYFEARLFAYELLRKGFRQEPERGFTLSLGFDGTVRSFPFAEERTEIARGIALMDSYLSDQSHTSQAAFDRLHWDYTRMFIGPYKLAAPPWESAYRNKERLLFQAETLAVRQIYRTYGLQAPDHLSEPDDHIGLELDFMHQTSRMALNLAEQGDTEKLLPLLQDQLAFLEEHLLAWAPQFAADVAKGAETAYYQGLAHLLAGFLPVDRTILRELVQEA